MSDETIDNMVYAMALKTPSVEKPFLKKDLLWINDNNTSGTYSTNQIVFETTSLANNGRYNNYEEAFISIPLVITLSKTAGAGSADMTNNANINSDLVLALKNSNYNIIHNISIDYQNQNVIQQTNNLNMYLNFKLHSEMSWEDVQLNGPTMGYYPDSYSSWGYFTADSGMGLGMCNNLNGINPASTCQQYGSLVNEGILKRQMTFSRLQVPNFGRNSVLGSDDSVRGRTGANHIVNGVSAKAYYYDCILRLKDLPFFKEMPLTIGANIRITLTLNNNVSFQFRRLNTGEIVYTPGSFSNSTSITNPLMVCASFSPAVAFQNANNSIADATVESLSVSGGSGLLPVDSTSTFTASMAISRNSNGTFNHARTSCRLYVPAYTFSPSYESLYLSNKQRKISYLDVNYFSFSVAGGGTTSFTQNITNGLSRMKRIIMIGMLSASANSTLGISPASSPFASEPSTTSPFILSNFNVQIGGINFYQNQVNYTYEQFVQELNGQYGVNSNKIMGACSSIIDVNAYNSGLYKYIVLDVSRRLPQDENVAMSVSMNGQLTSLLAMDFHVFIEVQKDIVIDVSTGAKLS